MYLTQSLHRSVQQHPHRIAVRWGEQTRTFGEFADRVARFAGALQKLGVQSGDRVAMLSLNSERYLEYQMAVPWAGAVLGWVVTQSLQHPLVARRNPVFTGRFGLDRSAGG